MASYSNFFDKNIFHRIPKPRYLMDVARIQDISNALSDEMRIRILEALLPRKPLRYTEIMKELGLDVVADSSKFAYHMGILCDAGLTEKRGDYYGITHGGRELMASFMKVSEDWQMYRYRDTLMGLTGRDVVTKMWSSTFLLSSPFLIFNSFAGWGAHPSTLDVVMLFSGALLLVTGGYGYYKVSDGFSDIKLERFIQNASRMLAGNGKAMSLIQALAGLGIITLSIIMFYIENGYMSYSWFALLLTGGAILSLALGVHLSSRLSGWWEVYKTGGTVHDYSVEIDRVYYLLMVVLVASGFMMITGGRLGGGAGVLGAALGIWSDYSRYSKSLKRNP